jgi:hypothetical protein
VYTLSDGSDPANSSHASYGFGNWSDVAVDAKVDAAGSTLYGLFFGTSMGATLPSGVLVQAGISAQHFRSGCMKYTIATPAQLAAGPVNEVLTQAVWSTQLPNTARYYEGTPSPGLSQHGYLRFSEQMPWGPRGLSPTALALIPAGGIVVAHANAAWGPDREPTHINSNGYGDGLRDDYSPPDGSAGYWNLTAFDGNGAYLWRSDGNSIRTEAGAGGFFNDVLSPTALAVAIDSSGQVYSTGRRTKPIGSADGWTTFGWDAFGVYLWNQDLSGTTHAIGIMPGSGNVVVGADRTNTWAGASSAYAELFEMRTLDGQIQRTADLGSIAVYGLQPQTGDTLAFVTDKL